MKKGSGDEHGGFYAVRGTLLGSLSEGGPTIWGSILGGPLFSQTHNIPAIILALARTASLQRASNPEAHALCRSSTSHERSVASREPGLPTSVGAYLQPDMLRLKPPDCFKQCLRCVQEGAVSGEGLHTTVGDSRSGLHGVSVLWRRRSPHLLSNYVRSSSDIELVACVMHCE